MFYLSLMGCTIAQLVETMCYSLEGHGCDSQGGHWDFLLTSFWPHYGHGIDLASNRNED